MHAPQRTLSLEIEDSTLDLDALAPHEADCMIHDRRNYCRVLLDRDRELGSSLRDGQPFLTEVESDALIQARSLNSQRLDATLSDLATLVRYGSPE
jgi:hypothetical protein